MIDRSLSQFLVPMLLNPRIQFDSLQRICKKLDLDWQKIIGLDSNSSSRLIIKINSKSSEMCDKETVKNTQRTIIIKDNDTKNIKAILTLVGDLESLPNLNIVQTILKEYVGSSIEILDVQKGSIKIFLLGSQEDIKRFKALVNSHELSELSGLPIQNLEITDLWDNEKENNKSTSKWKLVENVITNSLSNRQLQKIDFSDIDFRGATLSEANLSEANLSGADLSGANLIGANLIGADLSEADLSGANLRGAILIGADLNGANLIGAILIGATLIGADLTEANLGEANLTRVTLSEANLSGADLSGANLIGANLIEATLTETQLSLCRSGLAFCGADLSGADLSGADFRGADLSGANLSGAILSRSDLSGAILSEANLSGAILLGADLSEANLSRANLRGANLSRANVKRAIFIDTKNLLASDRTDLERRGAIFGDRPPVFSLL
jgi:uncharacterized protein YjbI with pentapeptide repeats